MSDGDILNFALNLGYLEAQFYTFAATGSGHAANLLTGSGTQGAATGGRAVTFTDPVVRQYANEIALDERQHVTLLFALPWAPQPWRNLRSTSAHRRPVPSRKPPWPPA